jgi:SAM-dependent methyltransferase
MRHLDAVDLITDAGFDASPSVWIDLGSGEGTFTRALASLLAPGSVVHAVDRDGGSLTRLRAASIDSVRIESHEIDFLSQPWPVAQVDGILMANSLHYVVEQRPFIELCASRLRPSGRFLLVEYDLKIANPWVPFPISRKAAQSLFGSVGFAVRFLAALKSSFGRAEIYSAVVERSGD